MPAGALARSLRPLLPPQASLYGQATGFETMVGWLFLQDPRRLAELLDHLEETDPLHCAADHEPTP